MGTSSHATKRSLSFLIIFPSFLTLFPSLFLTYLIEAPNGLDVNESDERGISLLQYTVMFPNTLLTPQSRLLEQCDAIQQMIELFGGDVGEDGFYDGSLLYFSIFGGNYFVVERLLERGLNPNLPGNQTSIYINDLLL